MDSEKQYWADLLTSVREGAGINQSELALKLGMNRSSVSLVETGARLPSVTTMQAWIAECGYAMRIVPVEEDDALSKLDDDGYDILLRLARLLDPEARVTGAVEKTATFLDTLEGQQPRKRRPRIIVVRGNT